MTLTDMRDRAELSRPRLLARVAGSRVVVVQAAAGYGKSVLARQLAAASSPSVLVDGADPDPLLAALARGLASTGWDDPVEVSTILRLLDGRAATILIIDDIDHARDQDIVAIGQLATGLADPHRLVALGRWVPSGAGALHDGIATWLRADELAFTGDEIAQLASGTEDTSTVIRAGTDGWPAAVAHVAARLRAGSPLQDALADLGGGWSRAAAPTAIGGARIRSVPLLDDRVGAAIGVDALVERGHRSGLPLHQDPDGWWRLAAPVRDGKPLDSATAAQLAAVYAPNALPSAVRMLVSSGSHDDAAELLEAAPLHRWDGLDVAEVEQLVDGLTDGVRRDHLWSSVSRARDLAGLPRAHGGHERISRSPEIQRAAQAERACAKVREGEFADAEALARRVLDTAGDDEQATRARALDALGRCLGADWTPEGVAAGASLLEQSCQLWEQAGEPAMAAQVRLRWARNLDVPMGRYDGAISRYDEVLAEANVGRRTHRRALTLRAEALIDQAMVDAAEPFLREAERCARLADDTAGVATVQWLRARIAAARGDQAAVAELLWAAERTRTLHGRCGTVFLADATMLLDRVGATATAWDYLERVRAQEPNGQVLPERAIAELALHARTGDPLAAEDAYLDLRRVGEVEPRLQWWIALLRAHAAHRRGDHRAGRFAATGFDQAAALGSPELAFALEPDLATILHPLAVEAGSLAAQRLATDGSPIITVLGGFAVRRGTKTVALEGQPATLVQLVVVGGGRVHAEAAMDALWPDADTDTGRTRLRNLLARIRRTDTGLLTRDGDMLGLADGVEVDLDRFTTAAGTALRAAASGDPRTPTLVHAAIAAYRGPLLPGARFASWAQDRRVALERKYLALLDVALGHAEADGRRERALWLLDLAMDVDPLDEDRYLAAARLHLADGRRGRAMAMLRLAHRATESLGMPPSAACRALEASLRAA